MLEKRQEVDTDGDQIPDRVDPYPTSVDDFGSIDSDNDGTLDWQETGSDFNHDGDGVNDFLDDANGDGIVDGSEDFDGDGTADFIEIGANGDYYFEQDEFWQDDDSDGDFNWYEDTDGDGVIDIEDTDSEFFINISGSGGSEVQDPSTGNSGCSLVASTSSSIFRPIRHKPSL
jgi:cold shock CspA family protein